MPTIFDIEITELAKEDESLRGIIATLLARGLLGKPKDFHDRKGMEFNGNSEEYDKLLVEIQYALIRRDDMRQAAELIFPE
jgi:hypothetical protein